MCYSNSPKSNTVYEYPKLDELIQNISFFLIIHGRDFTKRKEKNGKQNKESRLNGSGRRPNAVRDKQIKVLLVEKLTTRTYCLCLFSSQDRPKVMKGILRNVK